MVQLNVYALAVLTKAVLPYMKSGGRIIQMASVAAFQPLPDMNIYAASKAFVLSFSRALGRELKRRGIMVTAVCPGWTRTEFFTVAQSTEHPESVRNFPGMARPADVVRKALGDSVKGKAVSVYGFHNKGHLSLIHISSVPVLKGCIPRSTPLWTAQPMKLSPPNMVRSPKRLV